MNGNVNPLNAFANSNAALGIPTPPVQTASGIASLDSPLEQQTKSEIRALAAEIAQLSATALEPQEFFDGFLPRVCVAMGAKAACVWRVDGASLQLDANHCLPLELFAGDHPSEAHAQILKCVAAEGQPILVPPGSVKLETDRPTNPIADSLIVVPVRRQDDISHVLEVVQRPSGGPAAQRGYLRFVAQMADLMSDYLRRQQLRELMANQQRLQRIEDWLTSLATTSAVDTRRQLAVHAFQDLYDGDRAILLRTQPRTKVLAVSGSTNIDARSATVLAVQSLQNRLGALPEFYNSHGLLLEASDRRKTPSGADAEQENRSADQPSQSPFDVQRDVDEVCTALGCRQLLCLSLAGDDDTGSNLRTGHTHAIVAYTVSSPQERQAVLQDAQLHKLARSIAVLLEAGSFQPGWLGHITNAFWPSTKKTVSPKHAVSRWLGRVAVIGLAGVIAVFPVPQQISATAILRPASKQQYYAPAAGVVKAIFAEEGEPVSAGQALVQIDSHELKNAYDRLRIELKTIEDQIDAKRNQRDRGQFADLLALDQLEFDLQELQTSHASVMQQLSHVDQRMAELTVSTRASGIVSTWDLENRLLNQPVQSGQLLVSTFDVDGQWRLELAIPEYRAGLVAAALDRADKHALRVRYSLASHPAQLLEAFATELAPQVSVQGGDNRVLAGNQATMHVVKTLAHIADANELPLKKDGAIARATLECGKVPLCWLVFRDAYWAVSSRIQMLW